MLDAKEFSDDWRMFIDGIFVDTEDTLPVINPATGATFARAPRGGAGDINDAVDAAKRAFADWRWTSAFERSRMLNAIAAAIESHADELAALETYENGKPINQSNRDVTIAASTFRYYAGGLDKFYGYSMLDSPDEVRKKIFEPFGVVGVVIPWNWPPMHTAQFVAPALAAGNTVVLKTAPETPLSSLRIARLASDILPKGVFNVVSGGTEPGAALTGHEDIDKIAFTGNDSTGELVLKSAADHITPTMLELGGKNATLVFPDADIEKAVSGVLRSVFYTSGQACSGTERLLLHEDVYEDFLGRFSAEVKDLVVGDGREEATQIGPLIHQEQVERVEGYVQRAVNEGATVHTRGDLPNESRLSNGFWCAPTVLTDVEPSMEIAREEVFGPVVAVMPFEEKSEALQIANDQAYGLAGNVWTRDINRAHQIIAELEVGLVGVNRPNGSGPGLPFGGYKRSGFGRKSDFDETMREFSQVKSVRIDLTDQTFKDAL